MNATITREFTDPHGRPNRVSIPRMPWDMPAPEPQPEPTEPTFATKADPVWLSERIGSAPRIDREKSSDAFGSDEMAEKMIAAARVP